MPVTLTYFTLLCSKIAKIHTLQEIVSSLQATEAYQPPKNIEF